MIKPFALAVCMTVLFMACTEEVDTSARYVFRDKTIVDYLASHDEYSQYLELLGEVPVSRASQTTLRQLLSARGHYTAFAPTNAAIDSFLIELSQRDSDLMCGPRWEDFYSERKRDSIKQVIVYNSIIDSGDLGEAYYTYYFPSISGGELGTPTLNDHKVNIYWHKPDTIFINGECEMSMRNRDIPLTNGVLHQMYRVIAPKDITAATYLQELIDEQRDGYLVMARCIQACGMLDTLKAVRDEVYEDLYQRGLIDPYLDCNSAGMGNYIATTPAHRKYGFTIFAETDDFWRSQGLEPRDPQLLSKLMQWIQDNHQYSRDDTFTTGTDYDSPDNLLYQWTTYHILPVRITSDRLTIHQGQVKGHPIVDYQITMGKRRLMKLYENTRTDEGVFLNRFPKLDNRRTGTYYEIDCDPDKTGNHVLRDLDHAIISDMVNCCLYGLDKPLSYNDAVRDNLHKERIRFDAMIMWPEATNSDVRKRPLSSSAVNNEQFSYIPPRSVYPFFEDLWLSDDCHFRYTNFWDCTACNLYIDEILCTGRFEIMFRLPPVPRRGTYELRYACLSQNSRAIAQIYFGDDPDRLPVAGIPFDFKAETTARHIGAEADTEDQEYNAEMDKQLRAKGYMKGAQGICGGGNLNDSGRSRTLNYRRIMLTQFMDPDKTYYLKAKTVQETDQKEFFLDYLEFCPKEVYDNPETPEDIW